MPIPTTDGVPELEDRLSRLIRLKRAERPDAAFWEAFQRDFHNRQLTALVRVQPWYARLGRACLSGARTAAAPTAALGALAVGAAWIGEYAFLAEDSQQERAEAAVAKAEATPTPPRFVVESDAEQLPSSNSVLAQPEPWGFPEIPTHYQIPVMAKPRSQSGFQLRAAPKSLTRSSRGAEDALQQSHGAQVISAERQN